MPREPSRRTPTPWRGSPYQLEMPGNSANCLEGRHEGDHRNTGPLFQEAKGINELGASSRLPESAEGNGAAKALTLPQVTLSREQQHILDVVKRGENVFFTGPAGTGKSMLLRAIIEELSETKAENAIAVTSTTGIAAMAIGGMTLHSYGGIGTGDEDAERLAKKICWNAECRKRWKRTRVWIIDEVSMLKPDLFDKLEFIARFVRRNKIPFGGIQLVLAGDFFQLPPVDKKLDYSDVEKSPEYVFEAKTWKACIQHPYFLREVFRQKDNEFIDILSSMRLGQLNEQQTAQLEALERPLYSCISGVQPALLLSSNEQARFQNELRLRDLPGQGNLYPCIDWAGWDVYREAVSCNRARALLAATIAPKELRLKIGAQVMLLKNVKQGKLVNGSIGKVIDFITVRQALKDKIEISTPIDISPNDPESNGGPDNGDRDEPNPLTQLPHYQHRTQLEQLIFDRYNADPTIAKKPIQFLDLTGNSYPPDQDYPLVEFTNGMRLLCVPMFFEHIGIMGNIEACRIQIPLILSWAITIHKSQGQTLDFVKIDFDRIFADGQAYVAVSRVTSMEGLQIVNFHPKKVHASQKVLEWHNRWQNWWKARDIECNLHLRLNLKTETAEDTNIAQQTMDDALLFDSYNTEISESLLEENDFLTKMVLDTSWMQEGLMDTDDEEAAYFDACNTGVGYTH